MRKIAGFVTSISLGLAMVAASPAHAQQAEAAAQVALTPGAIVYDSEGAEIGPIASVVDPNVVVTMDGNPITLPGNAVGKTEKGLAIGITRAQLKAAVDQAAAANAQALQSALVPGTAVHSAGGSAVLGQVKLADAEGVVIATPTGDVKLPKHAFFMSSAGLATSFTAEEFAEATSAAAPAANTTAEADAAAADKPAN